MYSADQGGPVIIRPINFSASGDNIIVPAVIGKPLNIFKLFFVVAAETNLIFKDGATELSGPITFGEGVSMVLDHDPLPWFSTVAGQAFIINSSAAVQISGSVYWSVGK